MAGGACLGCRAMCRRCPAGNRRCGIGATPGARPHARLSGRRLLAHRWPGRGDGAILTAGAWTSALLAGLGVKSPLQTRPLQMLLTEPAPNALAPVVRSFDRKLSLKQLDDGAYLIGGGWPARIADHEANRWEVLDESVKASLQVAGEVCPAVRGCGLARSWAGLEAFTPDELPMIGPVPGVEGVIVAAGFSGHGFALSPVVGDVLAQLGLGRDARSPLWS